MAQYPATVVGSTRVAAFFDLDKTVLAKASTLAFGQAFLAGGLISRKTALRAAYAQLRFARNGADEETMTGLREEFRRVCVGWDVDVVRGIVDARLHHVVDPLVFDDAIELIEQHRLAGHDLVLVSTSGVEVVEPIAAMFGFDDVIATQMEIVDGKFTGSIEFYAFGDHKAAAMRELASTRDYRLDECFAYTDSITDLPMLQAVGHPVVCNPDRALAGIATRHSWPVRSFTTPAALRTQALRRRAVAGAGLLAATAALAVAVRRPKPATHQPLP